VHPPGRSGTSTVSSNLPPRPARAFALSLGFTGGFLRTTLTTPNNYRTIFAKARPDLPNDWVVHHTLPQRYRDLMRQAGVKIDELQYLRGVERRIHNEINAEWLRFHTRCGGDPSPVQVLNFSDEISERFRIQFIAPEFLK